MRLRVLGIGVVLGVSLACAGGSSDGGATAGGEPAATAPTPAEPGETTAGDEATVAPEPGEPPGRGPSLREIDPSSEPIPAAHAGHTVEKAVAWTDEAGENLVVFASLDLEDDDLRSRYLFVTHHVTGEGESTLQREVRDLVEECEFDLFLDYVWEALGVTDLDDDGLGEITFAYKLACTSDVSPPALKLLLLEAGDKYILRGTAQVEFMPDQFEGGGYEEDPSVTQGPAAFRAHLLRTWEQIKTTGY